MSTHPGPGTPGDEYGPTHGAPSRLDPLDRFLNGRPCPAWCAHALTGHRYGYGLLDEPDHELYHRLHSRVLADLDPWGMRLILDQLETATAPDLPDSILHPANVTLTAPECGSENIGGATGLRTLAAVLLQAADLLAEDPAAPEGVRR